MSKGEKRETVGTGGTWERQECERHVSKVLRRGRHRRDGIERRDKRHLKREREIQEGQKIHDSYL